MNAVSSQTASVVLAHHGDGIRALLDATRGKWLAVLIQASAGGIERGQMGIVGYGRVAVGCCPTSDLGIGRRVVESCDDVLY